MNRFTGLTRDDVSLLEDRFGVRQQAPLSLDQAAQKYGIRREEVRARESHALFQLECMRVLLTALKFHQLCAEEPEDDVRDMYPNLYAKGA